MFCKACGNDMPESASFCPNCGAPTAVTETGAAEPQRAATQVRPPGDTPAQVGPEAAPPPVPAPPPPVYIPPAPDRTIAQPGHDAQPAAPPPGMYGAPPPGMYGGPPPGTYSGPPRGTYGGAPPQQPSKSRFGLWIGLAATALILIAAGLILWLVVFDEDDDTTVRSTTTTAGSPRTTSTTGAPPTTASSAPTSTSAAPTTTAPAAADPGDSAGEWVELDNSAFPEGAYSVAVSDEALLIDAETPDGYALYAYMLDSGRLIELPIDASDFFDADVEGRLAVWWEGDYDSDQGDHANERICAYLLPDGPKVYVTEAGLAPYYPQIGDDWIAWAEATAWDNNPEEYYFVEVYGVEVDKRGEPLGEPGQLVWAATAFVMGDVAWSYSLTGTHLAWENATAVDGWDPGLYLMDFGRFQPELIAEEAWRPSLSRSTLVYTSEGLMAMDLIDGRTWEIDPLGDFATAAPTFATYFRAVDDGEGGYEIVARGYSDGFEQVLGTQSAAPWMSPPVAASARHVAFTVDGTVHLFEWQSAGGER